MLPWALRNNTAPVPGFGRLLGTVLAARGVSEPERLLNPRECGLPENAEKAAALIKGAKKVMIAGDYDCDGLCGTAILLRALKMLHKPAVYSVPSRERGYGFHKDAVDGAVFSKCDLIVAVDCGVSSQDTIDYAVSKGIKVIVADHHHYDVPPKKCVLVHPKGHENPSLCGAGVAYKIVRAMGLPEYPFLQLAAIATLADAANLTEGNRAIVRKGLSQAPLQGTKALLDRANAKLNPESVCYQIAPRINAASRVDEPEAALKLLMADDPRTAAELAYRLDSLNEERKSIVDRALSLCGPDPVVMLDAPVGVVGIVAGRLSEILGVPAAVLTLSGRGSARAPEGYSLIDALKKCPSVQKFGGHDCAAGFEIDPKDFDAFREEFLRSVEIGPYFLEIDASLGFMPGFMPSPEEVQELQKIGPFGPGNPEPLFLYRGTASVEKREKFCRVSVGPLCGILFNKDASWFHGRKIAVVGSLRVSDYTGSVESLIKDMRLDVHISRNFLVQAYKALREKKPLPDVPAVKVALKIFRELDIEHARARRNLFASKTYRRYALEIR